MKPSQSLVPSVPLVPVLADPESSLVPESTHYEGPNIGGNTVTTSTAHLPEEQRLLVRWLHTYVRDQKFTTEEISVVTKINYSTLSRIWTDKYRDKQSQERRDISDICERIAQFKRLVDSRAALVKSSFVETTVYREISFLCERAFIRQRIGFIFGESQVGKTTCLQEYQRRNNHGQTTYVAMPPSGGVQLMLRTIAQALKVSDQTSFDRVLTNVIAALDSSKCLIVDELHLVFTTYAKTSITRCLDVLRRLYDESKCGLVLCSTDIGRHHLERGEFAQFCKQLQRRAPYTLQLGTLPPQEDVLLIAKSYGLDEPESPAKEIVDDIIHSHGLGMLCARLADGGDYAAKKKQSYTWDHFILAHAIMTKMSAIKH